ncbi:hypothetical protein [Croceicoccus marinus]|uniref:hypothetical protein n=1 Tax=Croceicoccus marinus TaxID=450378 RepID=UPI0012FCCD49|nr:hypothetical protein [Croceicoccus marinus]
MNHSSGLKARGYYGCPALPLPEWRGDQKQFNGPGLYGVFLDKRLFYIGLYAGKEKEPFAGSVLERWRKHITYHILRSPEIRFAPSILRKILETLNGAGSDALADCLPAKRDVAALPVEHALINAPGSCTLNKVRFADQNPDLLHQDKEALLERFSFVYVQWPREDLVRICTSAAKPSMWVKSHWLASMERELIRELRPICNSQTSPGTERSDVGPEEFEVMVQTKMESKFEACRDSVPAPASAADMEALAEDEESLTDPNSSLFIEGAADVDRPKVETLLEDLELACPSAWEIYSTNTPDIRIQTKKPIGRTRVLLTLRSNFWGDTEADIEMCNLLGFEAKVGNAPRLSNSFRFDPERHGPADLFVLAGVTLQRIFSRQSE